MLDIIAIGELLIDFASQSADAEGYPTLAAHPGGAPANFLAAAGKYGLRTAMLGKVGNDTFGKLLIGTLQNNGISTDGILTDDSVFTTLAFVTFDAAGDRSFSFARKPGADTCITKDEIRYDLIDEAKVLHFGTLSLTDEPAREATYEAVKYARCKGRIISFDPNLREPLWDDLEEAKKQMLWGIENSDIVKISDNEVAFLWDLSPEEGIRKLLNDYAVKLAYITCGAKGCICSNGEYTVQTDALKGLKVIDTTGAGDIFGGSAMSRFVKIGKAAEELTEDDLRDIAEFACRAAGLSTEKPGGISSVPSLEEIQSMQ